MLFFQLLKNSAVGVAESWKESNWGEFVTVICSGLLASIVRGGKIILSASIPNLSMSLHKYLRHMPVFYLSFLQVLLLKTFQRCLKSRPVFVSNVMCSITNV